MLEVHVNGSWVAANQDLLVQMILDGTVDRSTRTMDSQFPDLVGPLERFLGQVDCEKLASRLLERLHSMYSASSADSEVEQLRVVVEDRCTWDWPDEVACGRLTWVAGWLAELTDHFDRAIGHYSAFLQHRSRESRLRVLAYNNRGVLQIRLGRLEGVRDLARSVMLMENNQQQSPLPAACFNLLTCLATRPNQRLYATKWKPCWWTSWSSFPRTCAKNGSGRTPKKVMTTRTICGSNCAS